MAKRLLKYLSELGLRFIFPTEDPNGNPATLGAEAADIINSNFEKIEVELHKNFKSIVRWMETGTENKHVIGIAPDEKYLVKVGGVFLTSVRIRPYVGTDLDWIIVPLEQEIEIDISAFGGIMLIESASSQADGLRSLILEKQLA